MNSFFTIVNLGNLHYCFPSSFFVSSYQRPTKIQFKQTIYFITEANSEFSYCGPTASNWLSQEN